MARKNPKISYHQEASEKDLEAIAEIARMSFPDPVSIDEIKEGLEGKIHRIYLAKDGERVVGFNIWNEDEEDGQVWDWLHAVHPDYRGRKVGSRLMDRVIKETRELGYKRIRLKTYEKFHNMIRFCRRKGFIKIRKKDPDIWGENKYSIYFQYNLINGNGYSKIPFPDLKQGNVSQCRDLALLSDYPSSFMSNHFK